MSDEEWALVAPYLALLPEDAAQREHSLRKVFNGLRYVIRSGCPRRMVPNDLPPWAAVYQQAQRWLAAGCFEHVAADLRAVLWVATGRQAEPSAAVLDSPTLRSTPESGQRAGYDGHKRKKARGCTWRWTRSATSSPCTSPRPVSTIARRSAGSPRRCRPAAAAEKQGIKLEVVKLLEAKRGSVLLPRRWVIERSFAWATRFCRLVKDYKAYASTLAGLHLIAFAGLMLKNAALLAAGP